MKKSAIRNIVFAFGIVMSLSLIPSTVSAKGGVHINLPGISIGVSDRYSRNRHYNRYDNRYRYNRSRGYYSPSYRSTTRKSYRRSNNYYYQPRRVYTPSYRSNICPDPGYSASYYEGHGCYEHLDHYHCD